MGTEAQPVKARRLRPTARAWGLMIAGVVVIALAEVFGVNELRFFGIVLLLLPLITLLLRLVARPKIEIDRAVYPTTAAAGDRIRVVAEVRNKSIFGLEATSYMDTVTGTERKQVAGVLPPVASRLHRREGRRRRRIAYGLTRMRRGISQIGPLFLENVDGLGLTRRVIQVGEPVEIEVWPHVHNVDRLDIPALRTGSEAEIALGRSGDADDVVTREYRRSDALRRVHWRATARSGELRVRQEEHHAEVVALVVLDTAPAAAAAGRAAKAASASKATSAASAASASKATNAANAASALGPATASTKAADLDPGFELGVSVVASVLTRLHEIGYDTELLETATDADPDAAPQDALNLRTSASESLGRVMRHLMLVQPALQEDPEELEELHVRAASMGKGPLVFVTRTDRPISEAAVDLSGYGEPAIAILCGPLTEDEPVVRRFMNAGWQVVRMNSMARDPWGSTRRYGQSEFGVDL